MTLRIFVRPAAAADYPAFADLFADLGTGDPIPSEALFATEIAATTLIAESDRRDTLGFATFHWIGDVLYVRNLVTHVSARRMGVGRTLLAAVAAEARRGACVTWCLNVKPDNVAAIALYTRMGFAYVHDAVALRIDWPNVAPHANPEWVARPIEPAEDGAVERSMDLLPRQLAFSRTLEGRVLLALEEQGELVGAAIFNRNFPGAYPFRVTRPSLALPFLAAIRPHARREDTFVNVVVEGQPEVAQELLRAGAEVKFELAHMRGAVPAT